MFHLFCIFFLFTITYLNHRRNIEEFRQLRRYWKLYMNNKRKDFFKNNLIGFARWRTSTRIYQPMVVCVCEERRRGIVNLKYVFYFYFYTKSFKEIKYIITTSVIENRLKLCNNSEMHIIYIKHYAYLSVNEINSGFRYIDFAVFHLEMICAVHVVRVPNVCRPIFKFAVRMFETAVSYINYGLNKCNGWSSPQFLSKKNYSFPPKNNLQSPPKKKKRMIVLNWLKIVGDYGSDFLIYRRLLSELGFYSIC